MRIYLDTSIIREWFVNIIRGDRGEPFYIEFMRTHNEFEKFISIYGIAELIETLKNEPEIQHKKLTKEFIMELIKLLQTTINMKIIESTDKENTEFKGISLSADIIDFTYLCGDLKDAIHVEIAKSNKLSFVTKDDKAGRIKPLYPEIVGIRKFIRRVQKEQK